MSKPPVSIRLYDADITDLLNGWGADIALPRSIPNHTGVFENLQAQELIYAISRRNYPRAYRLLCRLEQPLSPTDAMAACLCALNTTSNFMNALLDHCPPIPEFQFLGVGQAASLLNVAVRHDKNNMLDILLRRGADPRGGPTPLTAKSPVEEAFCASAYCCMKRLLEIPDLDIPLTEEMLNTWGALTADPTDDLLCNPCGLWCCQLLLETQSGDPYGLPLPLPIPPQLRLGHALHHANFNLAASICTIRPLTEADTDDLLAHYAPHRLDCTLIHTYEHSGTSLHVKRKQEVRFLCQLLHCRPDLLQTPQLRSAVVLAALAMPEEDPFLRRWTLQLTEGPVLLPLLPTKNRLVLEGSVFRSITSIDPAFFTRWEERLPSTLIPTIDINTPNLVDLTEDMICQVLDRFHLIGSPSPHALSPMATALLAHAPEPLLPGLLQPDGLLGRESQHLLLEACQNLPLARRGLILPEIQTQVDYHL